MHAQSGVWGRRVKAAAVAGLSAAGLCVTFAVGPVGPVAQAQDASAMGGIGVGFSPTAEGLLVERVAPGGPAAQAGVMPGDRLLAVNGVPVEQLTGNRLVDALRGPVGSAVGVTFLRQGYPPVTLRLTRMALGALAGAVPAGSSPPLEQPASRQAVPPATPSGTAAPAASAAQPRPPQSGGVIRLVRQELRDPKANDLAALRYWLPEGWQARGQVHWMHQYLVLADVELHLQDPATGLMVSSLPQQNFVMAAASGPIGPGGNWLGAIVAQPPANAAQFVQWFWAPAALPHLRGLTPVSQVELPRLGALAAGGEAGWQGRGFKLRYQFMRNGQPWEQDVWFALTFGPHGPFPKWNVRMAQTVSARRGELDARAPLLQAVTSNIELTPEWIGVWRQVSDAQLKGALRGIEDTARLARQFAQNREETRRMNQQVSEERAASQARITEARREVLGGVEAHRDMHTQQRHYVPTGYSSYWTNARGDMLLIERHGFDPNIEGRTNEWKRMERTNPLGPR